MARFILASLCWPKDKKNIGRIDETKFFLFSSMHFVFFLLEEWWLSGIKIQIGKLGFDTWACDCGVNNFTPRTWSIFPRYIKCNAVAGNILPGASPSVLTFYICNYPVNLRSHSTSLVKRHLQLNCKECH